MEWRCLVSYQEYLVSETVVRCSLIWSDESHGHFDVIEGLVPTWSNINADTILWRMEAPGQLLGSSVWDWGPFWCDDRISSFMIRCECIPFQCNVFTHGRMYVQSLSDKMRLDISAEPFWRDVFTHGQMWVLCLSDNMGLDVSAVPFQQDEVGCKCKAFSMWCACTWSNISAEPFWQDEVRSECWAFLTRWGQMWVLGVPFWQDVVGCKSWAGHYNLSVRYKC